MKQYIFILLSCCLFLFSCDETEKIPEFGTPVAETEIGKKIIESGVFSLIHSESQTAPTPGLAEYHINFLGFDGYLGKAHIYEVDLATSGLHVAVCNANNSNSSSSFTTQLLSDQVKLVDSESNQIYGAISGGKVASSNSRPYGILVKNGATLRSAYTSTGSNATTLYFGITKEKKAIIGEASELGKTVAWNTIQDAIGGREWLIRDGVEQKVSGDSKTARVAVGIIGDSKVVFFVVDGGGHYFSNGMLNYNVGKILSSLGVDNAISINDGTACTFIGRNEESELAVTNFPSNNGIENKLNHGLIVVKR